MHSNPRSLAGFAPAFARLLPAARIAALAAMFVGPGTALAQDANQAAAAEESGRLEEITVTARFREEPLQRTPLAITAVTGAALELRNATTVADIGHLSPNVTINPLGAGYGPTVVANIRGIGLTDFKPVFEPGVPIYVDDVVLARATGAVLDLLDLDRVEVLRGPQGTLFGKNAAGGAIRMISRKPTGDGPGFVEAVYGDYNRIDFRGAFETTLVKDRVFGRLSFSSKKRDGYVDELDFVCQMKAQGTPELAGTLPTNISGAGSGKGCKVDELGGEDVQAARLALRFVGGDRLEFNLIGDITDDNSPGPADKTLAISGTPFLPATWNTQIAGPRYGVQFDNRFITNNPFTTYSTFEDPINGLETPNISHVKHWGISGTTDFKITDALNLKVILAHRKFDAEFGRDSDGSPLPLNHTFDRFVHEQDSAEVRLNGSLFNNRTDWTLGAFYFTADDFQPNFVVLYPNLTPATLNRQALINRIDDQDTDNYAAFLHTVNHLTDALTLTVGARYTHDKKDFTVIRSFQSDGSLLFPITSAVTEATRTTPMTSLSYQWTDTINTYVSWQRGFRGGGFNPRPATAAQVTSFNPEDLDSYEVGLKSEWFDNRLRVNLAAFYVKYTDMQLPSVFVGSDNSVTFPPLNAGKAHMDGVELEFQANPFTGFHVDGSVGYLGFQYEDLGKADPAFILAQTGNVANSRSAPCKECRPLRAPEWTSALGAQYTLPVQDVGSFTLRADASYQSRVFYSANNFFRASQKAYTLINANVNWQSPDESWQVALSGTNLGNKLYLVGALDFLESLGTNEGQYGRPREWAISVKRRF